MSLARILILGILALLVLMFIAQAVAAMIPYLIGLFVIWIIFIWLQRWLSGKDKKKCSPHRFQTIYDDPEL